MIKLLEEIDELLTYLEDTSHGEEGRRITEMRYKILTALSNSHKHGVMQGLHTRSQSIALLENYSTFLCANGYMDTDWKDEPPYAIDEFMSLYSPTVGKAGEDASMSEGVRDWEEDFAHENGKYLNNCKQCGEQFMGHKRRIWCKICG